MNKNPPNTGLALLLRSELNKLANSLKYNGIVEDIYSFVKVFNERTPNTKYCSDSGQFYTMPKNRRLGNGSKIMGFHLV